MENNPHGIRGVDHFSVPCKDPELSQSFYETVLNAKVYEDENGPYVFGVSEEDKRLGRSVHIFVELDSGLRIELLEAKTDGTAPLGTHHAFSIGPNDVEPICEMLEGLGVPYVGPATHRGTFAVSVYFHDLDGNLLEFVCWNGYPKLSDVPLMQKLSKEFPDFTWDPKTRRARV